MVFTSAIIFGTVLIFILLRRSYVKGKSGKIARQKVLNASILIDNKLELTESENLNGYLIGIDRINFSLLYMNFLEEGSEPVLIDLSQIKKAQLYTEDVSIYEQNKGIRILADKQVSKLKLHIKFISDQPDQEFVLYEYRNALEDYVTIKNRASYWCGVINELAGEITSLAEQTSKYA